MLPGIRVIPMAGHTRGSVMFLINHALSLETHYGDISAGMLCIRLETSAGTTGPSNPASLPRTNPYMKASVVCSPDMAKVSSSTRCHAARTASVSRYGKSGKRSPDKLIVARRFSSARLRNKVPIPLVHSIRLSCQLGEIAPSGRAGTTTSGRPQPHPGGRAMRAIRPR